MPASTTAPDPLPAGASRRLGGPHWRFAAGGRITEIYHVEELLKLTRQISGDAKSE
ncbi:hypothetical protein ACFYZ8_06845 [Streptomyces sp. NPDC001668]|uniref:hypothetical protein n=1 Tax=unclassified Streptomyces TaxID=2593676 RepID=UPI0033E0FA2B